MKYYILILVLCSSFFSVLAQPGTWQQKSDMGWNAPNGPTGRNAAVSFSIGNKGYIGTGNDGEPRNDFWEYDPIADSWTQKADFGGQARDFAVGFSIGGKGYIGTGGNFNDFWEYDTASNSWTRKADFAGGARSGAAAFSIGGKGYIGTGLGANWYNDFWEYDPVTDTWTQKAQFGGDAREGAIGFSIGGKGYIGTGNNGDAPYRSFRQDFWEYDPVTDKWTRKADFGGGIRTMGTGFSIGNKGYAGLGFDFRGDLSYNDFWEYDPVGDSWLNKTNFAGSPRNGATGFSIGNNGYIVSGWDGFQSIPGIGGPGVNKNDCWKYDTLANSWTQIANFGVAGRSNAVGFSIGGKGYLGMGTNGDNSPSGNLTDFWEYDTLVNSWSQKASFAGQARSAVVGFSIGNKGYVGLGGLGYSGSYMNDFWEFNPAANNWTQKASFPGMARNNWTSLSTDTKGYVGLGSDYNNGVLSIYSDFWEYDPIADSWTQKMNFTGSPRYSAIGFSIDNKGYIAFGTGSNGIGGIDSTFWEFDPAANNWTQKASVGSGGRTAAVGFSIGNKGYIGLGGSFNGGWLYNDDFWEYDPVADTWLQKASFGGGKRISAVGFSIGNKGYIGTGWAPLSYPTAGTNYKNKNDFWQYSPQAGIRTTIGDYLVASACPALSGAAFTWQLDNNNGLVLGINPNNNSLGATCWSTRILAAGTYRNTIGWFGGSQTQYGAYLPRNYLITPATQPSSPVTLRLYCTADELTGFINNYNTTYGSSYTQNDIRVIRYDGTNQDLDPTNNSNKPSDYTSITPTTISNYGASDEYRYFEFNTTGFSEFYIALSSSTGPLPVNLLNFSAYYNNGASELYWQTAQEENLSRFDVQRSTDGRQFITIAGVPATGHSNSIRSYSFADMNAGALGVNILYYRLVEIDLDSRQEYSKIVIVNIAGTNNGISVIPNPATDNITVHLKTITANDKASFIIADMTGRKIQVSNITLKSGHNTIPLSINYLSAGVYIIVVTSNETKRWAKFEKQ